MKLKKGLLWWLHWRETMSTIHRFATLALLAVFLFSCQAEDNDWNRFWITSEKATIYERASRTSNVLQELTFGSVVECSDKNMGNEISKGWLQVKSGNVRGFMEKKGIAGEELHKEIDNLIDGAKDAPVQASGLTGKKVSLLLKPLNDAFVIQLLKEPIKVDILERIVTTAGEKEKAKKQVWYKIRLTTGLAGFIPKRNLQLTTPSELNVYTQVRTPVSWYNLGEKEDPVTKEKGSDYLVTYESADSDIDTDFTRVELYTYDLKTKQYATALAKSGLYGILPLKITDAGNGGKIIEIREHPKGDKNKIHVMQYSFPKPIKIINEYTEDAADKEKK